MHELDVLPSSRHVHQLFEITSNLPTMNYPITMYMNGPNTLCCVYKTNMWSWARVFMSSAHWSLEKVVTYLERLTSMYEKAARWFIYGNADDVGLYNSDRLVRNFTSCEHILFNVFRACKRIVYKYHDLVCRLVTCLDYIQHYSHRWWKGKNVLER